MSTHKLNLNDARNKRHSKMMSDEEKKEILDYLKEHETDPEAIPYLMKKHNCSNTTIGIIILNDEMSHNRGEKQ